MAVGRISGPLLKANLLRNGVDLAFETDLLYLDVNNNRIGVKTNSPAYDVDVNGTINATNLQATNQVSVGNLNLQNNTISSNLGTIELLPAGNDPVIYHSKIHVDSLEINVLPNPDATIVNPNPNEFCTWDTVITVLNKDTSGIGEWWSNPIGAISSTGLFDPSFGQLGEFEIFYGISGLCSDTNSTSVTIHSVKDPTIKSIPTLCEIANEEILEAVDVGVWSINGESSSGIFKAQNIGPGLHSITNSINDNCPVSDTLYIEVKENPISFFNSDTIAGI